MIIDSNITVAIPTLGRVALLRECLRSISENSTLPLEVLIADQSGTDLVVKLASEFPNLKIRVLACEGKGVARNRNLALRSATTDNVLITDDDCVVTKNWIETSSYALSQLNRGMITGMVCPGGDNPDAVPSTMTREYTVDFTGTKEHGSLYPNNMGVDRHAALEIGGFDERKNLLFSEDLDFSYRWLCAGKQLVYIPESIVTHVDWRSPRELVQLYKRYARYAGRFYGKHLAQNDRYVFRYIKWDLRIGLRAWRKKIAEKTPAHMDERLQLPLLMPVGIVEGMFAEWMLRLKSPKPQKPDNLK